MIKTDKYYSIKIELSNGEFISKSDIRAMSIDYAWEEAYDEEDTQTVSIIDEKGIYHLLTRSHIIQVVVKEIDSPETIKNKINSFI